MKVREDVKEVNLNKALNVRFIIEENTDEGERLTFDATYSRDNQEDDFAINYSNFADNVCPRCGSYNGLDGSCCDLDHKETLSTDDLVDILNGEVISRAKCIIIVDGVYAWWHL